MYEGVKLRGQGTVLVYDYYPMSNEEILKLYCEFLWNNHNDLCRHSQFIANEHNRRLDKIEDMSKNHAELDKIIHEKEIYIKDNMEILTDEEKEDLQEKIEWLQLRQARIRESISNANEELNSSVGFMRKSFIVTLWSIVEQFSSSCIDLAESKLLENVKKGSSSYIWDDMKDRFKVIGIDLESIMGYEDINECRIVNNKIKHVGYVDRGLVRNYPCFTSYLGKDFRIVELDLQRYSDSVYDFLVSLMGILENKINLK